MLRFHLDEHMDHAIARGLRNRSVDSTTTGDAELLGAEDSAHVEFGLREGRVVVTNDPDFLAIAVQTTNHAGSAYIPRNSRSIGHIVRCLCLMSDCLEPADMVGKVEFI